MPGFSWDRRIARAGELSQSHAAVSELLKFYQGVARFQKQVYEKLASAADHSVSVLLPYFPGLFTLVAQTGSPTLVKAAENLAQLPREDLLELLTHVWQPPAQDEAFAENGPDESSEGLPAEAAFFARALLQPYGEYLVERTRMPEDASADAGADSGQVRCPFCGSKPQLAVLRPEGDGGKRSLMCCLCATEWNFRRVVCPNCGEQNKDHLPIFVAKEFDYVRVDACDTCHTYIKSIDLSKNGNAIPVVDELATVSLNLWAADNNFHKLSPNLFGV
jgi:FdhE protein